MHAEDRDPGWIRDAPLCALRDLRLLREGGVVTRMAPAAISVHALDGHEFAESDLALEHGRLGGRRRAVGAPRPVELVVREALRLVHIVRVDEVDPGPELALGGHLEAVALHVPRGRHRGAVVELVRRLPGRNGGTASHGPATRAAALPPE